MADLIHGNTQVGSTKQDIISAVVQKELKFAAMLAPYFYDVSQFAVKGMKSITFPKLGSFTAVNRASGAAGDATVVVATGDKMDLDQTPYISYIIDPNDAIQSTVMWEMELAKRAGAAQARFFDAYLLSSLIGGAGLVAGVLGTITEDDILDMREFVSGNEGQLSESVLLIGPDLEKQMLKIDRFTRAQDYGTGNIASGVIGRVHGLPVVVYNGMTTGQAIVANKYGLAYGFQLGPQTSEQPANQYGATAKRVAVDQLFGAKALQIDAATKYAPIATKSPLIAKLG
jgi:hypothetical protein